MATADAVAEVQNALSELRSAIENDAPKTALLNKLDTAQEQTALLVGQDAPAADDGPAPGSPADLANPARQFDPRSPEEGPGVPADPEADDDERPTGEDEAEPAPA